jgi:hypothetical protein
VACGGDGSHSGPSPRPPQPEPTERAAPAEGSAPSAVAPPEAEAPARGDAVERSRASPGDTELPVLAADVIRNAAHAGTKGRFVGVVTAVRRCPPCPKDAMCKPCADTITVEDTSTPSTGSVAFDTQTGLPTTVGTRLEIEVTVPRGHYPLSVGDVNAWRNLPE